MDAGDWEFPTRGSHTDGRRARIDSRCARARIDEARATTGFMRAIADGTHDCTALLRPETDGATATIRVARLSSRQLSNFKPPQRAVEHIFTPGYAEHEERAI